MSIKRYDRGKQQFAVIGLGRFGTSLAKTLYAMGKEVLAIDIEEERIQAVVNDVTHAVQADATDEDVMKSLGIRNIDVVLVSIGPLQQSILATMIAKELGVKHVVCKAVSELHGKILEKLGADRVVYPERDMGTRVAHSLVSGNILEYIELSSDYSIIEVIAKKAFVNKTIRELDFRAKYGINIIAIKRGKEINISPNADFEIHEGDILVAIGSTDKLKEMEEI
ncbi:MAG: TrkA family potassium uptake protein [Firmicutes bacterium]|nr:TrkA family potassium uptake protein [Bacillota bacterium]